MPWVENFQRRLKNSDSGERVLISGGFDLKGFLFFTGDGSVDGMIKGSLESTHHLIIEEPARITGPCQAASLHVAGQIAGDVTAHEHVRLAPDSSVRGHICSSTLEITSRADFEGSLEIGVSPLA